MSLYFNVCNFSYVLTGDVPATIGTEIAQFLSETPKQKCLIPAELRAVSESDIEGSNVPEYLMSLLSGDVVFADPFMQVYVDGTLEHRLFFAKTERIPVAIYKEQLDGSVQIIYWKEACPTLDIFFLEYFSFDRRLAKADALLLHCCFIEHEGEAILFTAPSGTGKSTQGALWERFAQARVINGDRGILQVNEDCIMAYGLPFCGSSAINLDEVYPVKAIVYLYQAPENVIFQKPSFRLLRLLMDQTTMNPWNSDAYDQALGIWDKILSKTKVLEYPCTPTEEAVLCLKNYLEENTCN